MSTAKNIKYYLNCAIVFLLMFGFPKLPTIEPLTDYGMQVVGIFLGCLYGWNLISVVWPSFLGLLALGFTEYGTMQATFASAYGSDRFMFVFFMLTFAALITQSGVTDYIAKWVISRKIARGKPWGVAGLVYLAAYIVGGVVSVLPSIVICWTLVYQLCAEFGYTNKDLYPKLLVRGVVNAALMGHCVFPFKAFAIIVLGVLNTQLGLSVNYVLFTLFAFVLGFGGVIIWMLLCKYVYKPDVSLIKNSTYVYENTDKLTRYQKQVLVLLAAVIFLMFLPGFLPECAVKRFLSSLGTTGTVVAALMLCTVLKRQNGESFADIVSLIKMGVPWPTMILLATAMALALALNNGTGVGALLQQFLEPILEGHGVALFFILVIIFGVIITNIANNVVVAMILMPIVCTFSGILNFPPEILAVACCLTLNITFFFPSGSPIAAFLHGNSEWVSSVEIQKYTWGYIVLMCVWCIFICLTLGNIIW